MNPSSACVFFIAETVSPPPARVLIFNFFAFTLITLAIAFVALSYGLNSNAPTGPRAIGFTLVMEDGSGGTATTNWPASIQWANGVAPTLTANGKDILVFYTYDGGSTYYGFLSANNIS